MPNWKKLIVSGSDASLNSLNVTNNVTAQSFTGSFSGSFTAPGATTQVVYNNGGVLAANSGFVYSGSNVGIGTTAPTTILDIQPSSGTPTFRIARTGGTDVRIGASVTATGGFIGTFTASPFNIYTNSSAKVTVTSDGNVGIGTTSPSSSLDVVVSSGATSGLRFRGFSDAATPYLLSLGTFSYPDHFQINSVNGLVTMGIVGSTGANPDLAFQTNTTERMRIVSTGDVQIGTTAYAGVGGSGYLMVKNVIGIVPDNTANTNNRNWAINANGQFNGSLDFVTSAASASFPNDAYRVSFTRTGGVVASSFTGSFSGSVTAPGSTTQIVYNDNGVLAANSGLVYSGSNVGIGITSPTEKLHIVGTTSGNQFGRITATDSDSSAAWVAQNDSGDNVVYRVFSSGVIGTQMGNALSRSASLLANLGGSGVFLLGTFSNTNFVLGTNNTERMRITNGGNVGIGTTSPSSQLTLSKAAGNAMLQLVNADESAFSLKTYNSGSGTLQGRVFMQYLDYSSTINGYMAYHRGGGGSDGFLSFGDNGGERVRFANGGNVGIGTSSPGYKLEVVGAVSASTYYGDGSNLTNIGSGSISAAGSDGQLQYNNSGLFGGASRLYYNDSTNRVGIGTSSPGYDLDVSGSARVQDRLRVGVVNTGNGVIHQSSDATINPSGATIVWSVPGSAGICAFIEYYVFNSNTGTSQRAGNIVTTWNASGTPQITHTETSTPDIGSTSPITFSTSLTLGGDPQLIATNSGGDIWYMIMNYRYF
jgi:hypothetical protein